MKRIKSAPGNIAEMVNNKRKIISQNLQMNILPLRKVNKVEKKGELNIPKKYIELGIISTITEYISDPQILSIDQSPVLIYLLDILNKNLKKNLKKVDIENFIIQSIIKYGIGYIIHHHLYYKINNLIDYIINK